MSTKSLLKSFAKASAGQAMPSNNYVNLPVNVADSAEFTYTAPCDGYATVAVGMNDAQFRLTSSSCEVSNSKILDGVAASGTLPLKKGESVSIYFGNVTYIYFSRFVSLVGGW